MCFSCKEEKFCDSKLKTMAASFQFSELDQINCFIKFCNPKVISNRGRILSLPVKTLNKFDNRAGVMLRQGILGAATSFSRSINSGVLRFVSEKVAMAIG